MEYISRKKIMFELAVVTKESTEDSLYVKDSVGHSHNHNSSPSPQFTDFNHRRQV